MLEAFVLPYHPDQMACALRGVGVGKLSRV